MIIYFGFSLQMQKTVFTCSAVHITDDSISINQIY